MTSFRCFLKPPFSWIHIPIFVVALSILMSTCSWGYVVVLVLLSAFIFTFLTQYKNAEFNLDNRSIEKHINLSNELDDDQDVAKNGARENAASGKLDGSNSKPPRRTTNKYDNHFHQEVGDISYSESESNDISFSSEDYSDGCISDEESLIEIEIPSGNYLASPRQTQKGKQEEEKEFISKLYNFHQFKDPMFDLFDVETKRMFKKQSILDLLSEINEMNMEEENLIEIDIVMGSIKCPRFEIEA